MNAGSSRRPGAKRLTYTALVAAAAIAVAWIAVLATRPVHIPVFQTTREYEENYTQVLSGIKGQTFVAAENGVSRIDLWAKTVIPPGESIGLTFALYRSPNLDEKLASNTIVFRESRSQWNIRLLFDSDKIKRGDEFYLRLRSSLSSPYAHLFYAYFRSDFYPAGQLHDLDRVEFSGQDLKFHMYRDPAAPKPFAWIEAVLAPALRASAQSAGPPPWVIVSILATLFIMLVFFIVVTCALSSRMLASHAQHRVATVLMIPIVIAVVLAIFAGSEAPIGKLDVWLS